MYPGHSHTAVALAERPLAVESPAQLPAPKRPSRRSLISLGLAGGMLPSPSALLVLLAGIALHRTALALVLVLAYGAGMAVTLCGAGILVLRVRGLGRRFPRMQASRLLRWLPVAAGLVVTAAGLQMLVRAGLTLV